MARTITGTISDIYRGETAEITVLCKRDSVAQDITSDTVTMTLKSNKSDADSSAVLQVDANVATYGASGIAYWNLTPAQTDITADNYFIDIAWYDGTDEFIVYDGTVNIIERVSDV